MKTVPLFQDVKGMANPMVIAHERPTISYAPMIGVPKDLKMTSAIVGEHHESQRRRQAIMSRSARRSARSGNVP